MHTAFIFLYWYLTTRAPMRSYLISPSSKHLFLCLFTWFSFVHWIYRALKTEALIAFGTFYFFHRGIFYFNNSIRTAWIWTKLFRFTLYYLRILKEFFILCESFIINKLSQCFFANSIPASHLWTFKLVRLSCLSNLIFVVSSETSETKRMPAT